MDRRNFIRNSSLAGLSITSLSLASCTSTGDKKQKPDDATTDHFEWNEITIDELQKRMASGQTSAHALTQSYLDRIGAIDKNGPRLNAVIELNPDAISIADAMDKER